MSGFVFYDENANGVLDPNELVRLPAVSVTAAGKNAQTSTGGAFTLSDVPTGTQSVSVMANGLPPYFTPGAAVPVSVPQASGSVLAIPATLATGGNRPNVYIAYGDSITYGTGSSDGSGYRSDLESNLRTYWGGNPGLINEGVEATRSNYGEQHIAEALRRDRAAYILIMYGTNDWNEPECRNSPPCYTIDSLRSMALQAKDASTFPILATIPEYNPFYVDKGAIDRNAWVRDMNTRIKAMAAPLGVPVADMYDAFSKQPNVTALYSDDKHPNDAGYTIMAQTWTQAITRPPAAATTSAPSFFKFFR